ncbi:MAG: hypothetical protein OEM82_13285 [Acidobacteriota bacterium]|nr:hypothetical protein [Acidobacteriota bacterium]
MGSLIKPNERNVLYALLAVGLVGAIGGLIFSDRFWAAFLQNAFYFLTISLGGAIFLAVNHVANASWISVLRRVPEAMTSYLPIGALALILIFFGRETLYEWTYTTYSHLGHELTFKNTYLSTGFFFIRMLVFLGVWAFLAHMLRRESYAQDVDASLAHTNNSKIYSAIFLVVFGITFTFASFDWIMSLEPMFFSTIYAFYHIAGVFLSGSAAIAVLVILLRRRGFLTEVGDKQLHNLGKLVLGFSTFWAYIWLCQYLLIYYANIPEETVYYLRRTSQPGWSYLFILNIFLNWIVPFILLMPRSVKMNENWMLAACGIVLIGHWLDLYVMIFPAFTDNAMIGLVDLTLPLGFAALFLLVFIRNLRVEQLIPKEDPYLAESMWQEP